jgi:hypothetical protein
MAVATNGEHWFLLQPPRERFRAGQLHLGDRSKSAIAGSPDPADLNQNASCLHDAVLFNGKYLPFIRADCHSRGLRGWSSPIAGRGAQLFNRSFSKCSTTAIGTSAETPFWLRLATVRH